MPGWLRALLAVCQLFMELLRAARDTGRIEGRLEAFREIAEHTTRQLAAARKARADARARDADPARLRDDDGFRRE